MISDRVRSREGEPRGGSWEGGRWEVGDKGEKEWGGPKVKGKNKKAQTGAVPLNYCYCYNYYYYYCYYYCYYYYCYYYCHYYCCHYHYYDVLSSIRELSSLFGI